MSEKNMSAFQPVLAVYRGEKGGERVMGTAMMVGLSNGHEVSAMVLDDQANAVRIGVYMLRKGIKDWSIELNPFVVNRYLEDLQREVEETKYPLLNAETLADETPGSWDDEA